MTLSWVGQSFLMCDARCVGESRFADNTPQCGIFIPVWSLDPCKNFRNFFFWLFILIGYQSHTSCPATTTCCIEKQICSTLHRHAPISRNSTSSRSRSVDYSPGVTSSPCYSTWDCPREAKAPLECLYHKKSAINSSVSKCMSTRRRHPAKAAMRRGT